MPINRLGPKPPVSSTDKTTGSGAITTSANFQGRNVSVAKQQQSDRFLPPEDARRSAHTISSTNRYIAARNITTASENENQVSEAHDYEEVGLPPEDEYVEMRPPSDDYEEMNPSSENYVNAAAPGNDYEEVGLPPEDEYVEMRPPSDDYEEMNPSSENYVNVAASGNDYEEVGSPPEDEYVEMRSVVDSSKASRARLSRFETLKIRQLGSECGDYVREVTGDLQKMTQCANNLSASSQSDISAFQNYLIPQHLNCINEYTRAIQILLKAHKYEPAQRKNLQTARNQLSALRNKLLLMRDIMGTAIHDKNFSTTAASNYADLRAERKSPARQVMKAQSRIVEIHRFVDEVKYRVNYLASFPSGPRVKAKEEIDEISFCQKSLVQAKAALPKPISDIKKAMDKVNDYEERAKEQPLTDGKQLTLRERRYTMHLANRLEGRVKRINNTIASSWDKLEKIM